jgi:transposase
MYLPPYSPGLNPIKEFFAKLKAFIKRSWSTYEEDLAQGLNVFLEWCVEQGAERARLFRHSRWTIDEV